MVNKKKFESLKLKKYLYEIIYILAFTGLGLILNLLQPRLFGIIIDRVSNMNFEKIEAFLIFLLLAMLLSTIVSCFGSYKIIKIGTYMSLELKKILYDKIVDLPLKKFDKYKSAEFLSRYEGDISVISNLLSSTFVEILINFVSVFVIGYIMVKINIELTLVLIIGFPFSFAITKYFAEKMQKETYRQRESCDSYLGLFNETIFGIKEIKSYTLEKIFKNKMEKEQLNQKDIVMAKEGIRQKGRFFNVTFSISINCLILFISTKYIQKEILTIGAYVAFSTYSTRFYNSLYNISEYYSSWKEAKISINRIKDFFDEMQFNNEDSDNNEYIDLDVLNGDIILRNINFTYDRNTILHDFSCRFKGRKCNLLIGQSGLGKTTICKLLLKFYEVETGQIKIGDLGLDQINRQQLRENIAYISQTAFFFSGTIRENLLFANANADNQEIIETLKTVGLYNYIHSLPLGIETVMGEAGNNFSEGQKQRLNIARGILKRPKIYIFDEPTSALDSKNREGIVKLIEEIIDKKTVIIITHDTYIIDRFKDANLVIMQGE